MDIYWAVSKISKFGIISKPHKKDFATLFKELPNTKKIAILFGPEQSGLSNEDLKLCDCIFTIPSSKNNHSYNLSHSVLLMSYMWQEHFRNFMFRVVKKNDLSDKKSFDLFMQFLRNELDSSGFLYPKEKSNSMFNNVQSMFLRAELSKSEIQTLWGMIKMFQNPKKR